MLTFLIVFLVSSSFAFDQNQTIQNEEKIEGKNIKNWDKNLTDFRSGQLHDNRRGKSSDLRDVPMVHGNSEFGNGIFYSDPIENYSNNKDELDSMNGSGQNISENYNLLLLSKIVSTDEVCKRMVGVSKSPTCEYVEEIHLNHVKTINKSIPTSCREIQKTGKNKSGIYEIFPKNSPAPFMVFCDMETRGGGWTVIQNRFDGSEDFYRDLRDYKFGFGNLNREYWIGLEQIHHITEYELCELLVEITDREKIKAYAQYNRFGVGSETEGYSLNTLSGFSGDAGDSLTYHLNQKFSTRDMDQDKDDTRHCAEVRRGAWWYKHCVESALNGKFINFVPPEQYYYQGIHWKSNKEDGYYHAGSRMMVRPV